MSEDLAARLEASVAATERAMRADRGALDARDDDQEEEERRAQK